MATLPLARNSIIHVQSHTTHYSYSSPSVPDTSAQARDAAAQVGIGSKAGVGSRIVKPPRNIARLSRTIPASSGSGSSSSSGSRSSSASESSSTSISSSRSESETGPTSRGRDRGGVELGVGTSEVSTSASKSKLQLDSSAGRPHSSEVEIECGWEFETEELRSAEVGRTGERAESVEENTIGSGFKVPAVPAPSRRWGLGVESTPAGEGPSEPGGRDVDQGLSSVSSSRGEILGESVTLDSTTTTIVSSPSQSRSPPSFASIPPTPSSSTPTSSACRCRGRLFFDCLRGASSSLWFYLSVYPVRCRSQLLSRPHFQLFSQFQFQFQLLFDAPCHCSCPARRDLPTPRLLLILRYDASHQMKPMSDPHLRDRATR